MDYITQNWREIGEYIALAGGWAAILGRFHHVYDAIVKEGGIVNIVKAFFFGSARWADEATTKHPTPPTP